MFKKLLLVLSCTVLLATNAQASGLQNFAPKGTTLVPYVGADIGISLFNGTRFPFNVHGGLDIITKGIDFGAEAFVQTYTSGNSFTVGVDALVYPVVTKDFDVLAGVGLDYTRYSGFGDFGLNILGGIRYKLTNNISLRARAKYFLSPNNLDITVGANYHF